MKIGFLHPGSMGVSIAAAAIAGGQDALWASEGRGEATRTRANEHGLRDVQNVEAVCRESEIICSICPPGAAEDVAQSVAAFEFKGIFVDCNAISPQRMARIAALIQAGGGEVVDAGIIGHPAWKAGTTALHLSGPARQRVAQCFAGSVLDAVEMSDQVGAASALKMCYAALTKGTAALLSGIIATAEDLGVRDDLYARWEADGAGRVAEREAPVLAATAKAWRWVDEMEEIARTFEEAGQPGGFHMASAEIFRRLSDLKDAPETPSIDTVLAAMKARH